MKTIIPIFILILCSLQGFSICGSSGLEFWPRKYKISPNSIFIIEGYADSQEIIRNLGKTHKVFLKSSRHKIRMKVEEILEGNYRLTQAILRPKKMLKPGIEYELVIENINEWEKKQVGRHDDSTRLWGKVKWKVTEKNDTIPPAWITLPKFLGNSTGDGVCPPPGVRAGFSFSAFDHSELLIKTTLKNVSDGYTRTYYLRPGWWWNNYLAIGTDGCAGEFNYSRGNTYEVVFSLLDASGNLNEWSGDGIRFKSIE